MVKQDSEYVWICHNNSWIYLICLNKVWIITSHFANCEVNSSHCHCNFANHEKNANQFLSQGEFNSSTLYFFTLYPNDIHILFIHCILLSKEVLLILKITLLNTKKYFSILKKKTFACSKLKVLLCSTYLLQSQFQTIIQMLLNMSEYYARIAWICPNLPEWLFLHVPIVIPCQLEYLLTYFSEVYSLKKHEAIFLTDKI